MASAPEDKPTNKSNDGDRIPLNLMKSLRRRKAGSESGSSSGGNNSEDSALVSLGNSSFGFNFDSEEGPTGQNSEQNSELNSESNSGQNSDDDGKLPATTAEESTSSAAKGSGPVVPPVSKSSTSSLTNNSSASAESALESAAHVAAANNAMASLQSIAASTFAQVEKESANRKRKNRDQEESVGYLSDDEAKSRPRAPGDGKGKKKKVVDRKREERNAREKERSFRIAKQINELRELLSSGGIIVPKGTKSSVLTEAANYIRMLQQHQYRSEIDRQQLVQQMQLIGGGAHGPQAASAIRHVAAQNGVWSLGNFGGVPPKSAMTLQPLAAESSTPDEQKSETLSTKLDAPDYRFVFNSCGVALAIASMGGAFLDCNMLFTHLSSYSKQELCSLTIFNLTARQDLQQAFDQISQLISPPINSNTSQKPINLRGSMKNRSDLGLSISLVRGEDGIAKCFCVTLVKNPSSPYEPPSSVPVSFEAIAAKTGKEGSEGMKSSPAFTSG